MYGMEHEPELAQLADVVDIRKLLPLDPPTDDEMKWYESTKKIDANDLSAELGPERFRQYLIDMIRKAPVVYRNVSKIRSFRELLYDYPELREPVIDGLLRRGEIINIVASPKKGKSYMSLGLSMAVIQTDGLWLNTFKCNQGAVLIIDNELHKETCVDRTRTVANHLGIPLDYVGQWLDYLPLRGELLDIFDLDKELQEVRPGDYKLVILDALYRFMPEKMDENDNGSMAKVFNQLDKIAKRLDCAIALIHHTSKGLQSHKSVTDVGAGAGSQSRAADAHLVLRELEGSDSIRLDAANRSFPPVKPFCIKFKYPVWSIDKHTDPEQLKTTKREREQSERQDGKQVIEKIWQKVLDGLTSPCSIADVLERAKTAGMPYANDWKVRRQIERWEGSGEVVVAQDSTGRTKKTYVKAGTPKSTPESTPTPEQEIILTSEPEEKDVPF